MNRFFDRLVLLGERRSAENGNDLLKLGGKRSSRVGRHPLDTFATSTDNLEKGGFNASLQVH